jgi:adenylate kinase family enzyme
MSKIVIFGNSSSGKSTLAKKLAKKNQLAHLDLDSIAWKGAIPAKRLAISESRAAINNFLSTNQCWVIEGCYSDLLELVTPKSDEIIFLNLPTADCVANSKTRPWEPHKYASKKAQDANLEMLIDWISQYTTRNDTFSKVAHVRLFEEFTGKKTMYESKEHLT